MAHTIRNKKKLILRVRRIRGQIGALEKALQEERDCGEILQLIAASRGAINGLMAEILEGHLRFHIANPNGKPKSKRAAAREVIDVMKTYLK